MRDETHTLMSVRCLVTSAPKKTRKKVHARRDAHLDVCAVSGNKCTKNSKEKGHARRDAHLDVCAVSGNKCTSNKKEKVHARRIP